MPCPYTGLSINPARAVREVDLRVATFSGHDARVSHIERHHGGDEIRRM
jgi:hypothetical protein